MSQLQEGSREEQQPREEELPISSKQGRPTCLCSMRPLRTMLPRPRPEHSDEKVGHVSLDSNEPCVRDNPKTESLGRVCRARFSNVSGGVTKDAVMVLNTQLCEHAAYRGGKEKKYHRAANGHTRTVQCKEDECERHGPGSSPLQLWSILV